LHAVAKPAEATPLTALAIAEILVEAGAPEAAVGVLTPATRRRSPRPS
jgi:acyl-CoA reductase-like NAD-dependent aldehyde dehydrogenase